MQKEDGHERAQELSGQKCGALRRVYVSSRTADERIYALLHPAGRHKTVPELADGMGFIPQSIVNAADSAETWILRRK